MDTIFALASGGGKAGVAVIRISGPKAPDALPLFGASLPQARLASLRQLHDPDRGFLDEALVLNFEAGASFTGEPVVELQTHGSPAVVRRILGLLGESGFLRLADPGEFTRRAMDNGRMDLAQVEGLADLIDAETEEQRKLAQRLLTGELSDAVSKWRGWLIEARALLEATIDFADEDVPVDVTEDVLSLLDQLTVELQEALRGVTATRAVRNGFEVAIVGPPNAGKSTLLNRLAGREAALTSSVAGTTRDIIEVRMDVSGIPVVFLDTAGLREAEDEIEALGIQRAETRAREADLRVFLSDSDDFRSDLRAEGDLVLRSKDDTGEFQTGVSGLTGSGVSQLIDKIEEFVSLRSSGAGLVGHERHANALRDALALCKEARQKLETGPLGYDLSSEDIRMASTCLHGILGSIDVEALYDEVFSRFCLGK